MNTPAVTPRQQVVAAQLIYGSVVLTMVLFTAFVAYQNSVAQTTAEKDEAFGSLMR